MSTIDYAIDKLPLLRTPFSQLNTALGSHGGFHRGELIVIAAKNHNYREGLAHDLYQGLGLVNSPVMLDKTKIPAMVDIQFEVDPDAYTQTMQLRHRQITGVKDENSLRLLQCQTYHYMSMIVRDTSAYTLNDLFEFIDALESNGHEPHVIVIGDLSKIHQVDLDGKLISLHQIYARVREHIAPRGYTLITTLETERDFKYNDIIPIIQDVDTLIGPSCESNQLHIYCSKHRGSILPKETGIIPIDDGRGAVVDVPFTDVVRRQQ